MPISPARVGIAPGAIAIRSAISPGGDHLVNVGRNGRTSCPPATTPISAAPKNGAPWLGRDKDPRFRDHSHSRWRCFCRRRSLCCGRRWWRRIKVGSIGGSQNCAHRDDCGCGRYSNVTHNSSPIDRKMPPELPRACEKPVCRSDAAVGARVIGRERDNFDYQRSPPM